VVEEGLGLDVDTEEDLERASCPDGEG